MTSCAVLTRQVDIEVVVTAKNHRSALTYALTSGRAVAKGTIGQAVRVSFTERGFTLHDARSSSTWWWSSLRRLDETGDHLFLLVDTTRCHVIPKRCFASEGDVQRVRAWARAEGASPGGG